MKNLHRLTLLYLLLPFVLFALGWLRLIIAIPLLILLAWVFYQMDRASQLPISNLQSLTPNYQLLITFFWVFLSGIGAYAFQNWDHNWRNVVFHDLISYDFPVFYAVPEKGPIKMLVYYVGYWLPAVWVGKFFGWDAANFALFLWTVFGVTLVVQHIGSAIQTSVFKASLLLIFFSGMDALGVLLFPNEYPTLLPPVTHLEAWTSGLQYSSFTTQLFWVFNQAVPAWLCFALILANRKIEIKIIAGALSFFFAPLAAVGIFFYLLLDIIQELRSSYQTIFKTLRWNVFLAAVLIFVVSFLYFSSNTAAQTRGFNSLSFVKIIPFVLLEGGLLWLILLTRQWRSPRFMLTGVLLLVIPFFQIGSGTDFVMRVSIAPLFFLMLSAGKSLFENNTPRFFRIALSIMFLIGALTPLYEINRSVYRTTQYYLMEKSERASPPAEPLDRLEQPGALENVHPKMLTADDLQTLKFMNDELSRNFIANVRQSFFYRYLSSR